MIDDPDRNSSVRTSSLVTRLMGHATERPNAIAFREKVHGIWRAVTWADYWRTVGDVAASLCALGVERGARVAIHSENRLEWPLSDLGALAAGAVSVGIYPTSSAEEVCHILRDSGAVVLVAEDQEQVDKVLAVRDELPDLRAVVFLEERGMVQYRDPLLMSWRAFVELGRAATHWSEEVRRRIDLAQPSDPATFIYTSGTTGPPKGAVLSIASIEHSIKVMLEGDLCSPPPASHDVLLCYLPLCHVAERMFSTWLHLGAGFPVHFAESIDTMQENLREVQPTIFIGVPRIWEKFVTSAEIRYRKSDPLKRFVYRTGAAATRRVGASLMESGGAPTVLSRLTHLALGPWFFRPMRDQFGLRKCRLAISGAAPIAPEVLTWFMGLGIPIREAYGQTESAIVTTLNFARRIKVGTVGEPTAGVALRVDESTGEILVRHPGLFSGYWNQPELTEATLDGEGWLHTGDVGEWVDGTHVKIVDRMKDILITTGGKNISPSEIENALKVSPYVKEAVVIGDRRKYVTALIGIEFDTVSDWAQRHDITYTTYRDLSSKREVVELIGSVVSETNERFARVEQVKDFRLLPKELEHEAGELTATQKVRRQSLSTMFTDLIASMYEETNAS